jgi:hypothetical protein
LKTFFEFLSEQFDQNIVPFSQLGIGSVYHKGDANSIDQIDPFRLARKQNKKGRSYGGFYVGPLVHANTYPGNYLMKIDINPNARVLVSDVVDRLDVRDLSNHMNNGVDMMWGKDIRGFDQGVIINKRAITNTSVTASRLAASGDREETNMKQLGGLN